MSKFKVGDKVWCNGEVKTITRVDDWLYGEYGYYFHEEEDLELYKTPHQRLLDLGFIISDETVYHISYMLKGLDITIFKKEKTYQAYSYGDNYNPINLELAEILVDYLKELEK